MKRHILVSSLILLFAAALAIADDSYKPGVLMVRFADPTATTQTKNAILSVASGSSAAAVVKEYSIAPGLALVQVPTGSTVEQMRVFAALSPGILYAEPVYKCELSAVPNDTRFSELWGLNNTGQAGGTPDADIDAPEAWDLTTGDGSVIVAVVDSGVDYTHSDLAANMWHNPGEIPSNGIDDDGSGFIDDYYGCDTGVGDGNPMDDSANPGHGTHVSGIIGAVGNNAVGVTGVCWNVKIMAVKIADDDGTLYYNSAIEGIQYAVSKGAKVINISWIIDSPLFPQALYDAIEAAESAGVIFVVAAGNYDRDIDVDPIYPASYTLGNIISVMATSNVDDKASYSDYGLTSVDLAAPGGEEFLPNDPAGILSTMPGNQYEFHVGTSMATPYVAGACALVWTADPSLTYSDVKEFLLDYSDTLPTLAGLCVTGGRLNLYNSVHEVLFDSTSPSPDPAEWELVPQATGLHTIVMQAKEATDRSGVEYYFACTDVDLGGPNPAFDSGWQDSTLYTRSDFAENTTYTYTVKYRDKSSNHNETAPSTAAPATTASGTDNLPPFSNPSRWKIQPKLQRIRPSPRIGMEAMASTDETGPVSYYFTCVDVDGIGPNPALDSGWITTAVYTISSGLNVGSSYTFTVKARDFLLNETTVSTQATVTVSSEGGNILTVPRPYATIQDAINASVDGDTVEVRPGTYTGTGNRGLDFANGLPLGETRSIIVRSMDPNDTAMVEATIIDCQFADRAFYFHVGEDYNSVVTGFTIVNGLGMENPGNLTSLDGYGGAIACFGGSEPTITKCVIRNCFSLGSRGNNGAPGYDGASGSDGTDGVAGESGEIPPTSGGNGLPGGNGGAGSDGGRGLGGAIYFESGSPEIRECRVIACGAIGGSGGAGGYGGAGGSGGDGGNGANGGGASAGHGGRGGNGGSGGDGGSALGGAMYFESSCRPTIIGCEITGCGVINGAGAAGGRGGRGGDGGDGGNGGSAGGGGNGGRGGDGGTGGIAGVDGVLSRAGALYYAHGCIVTIADTIIGNNMPFIDDFGTHNGGGGGNGGDSGNGGSGGSGYPDGGCYDGGDGGEGYNDIDGDGDNEYGIGGEGGDGCNPGADGGDFPNFYNSINLTNIQGGGNYYEYDCIVGMTACTISDNDAGGENSSGLVGYGGGEYYETNCDAIFNNCKIEDNNAGVDGGGIYFEVTASNGTAMLNFCDVTGNSASFINGAGGGIFGGNVNETFTVNISDSNFRENDAMFGGGIYLERTNLTIEDSNLSGNVAFEGAGMWNYNCTATVKGCVVKENVASFGGGFSLIEGLVTIESTQLTGNHATSSFYGTGGGLFFEGWSDEPHQVTNCLITENTAYAYGGGLSNNRGSWVQLNNCTFAENDVIGPDGVGGGVSNAEFWAWVEIDNSILWGNRTEAGGSQIAVGNPYGSYPSGDGLYADTYVSNSDVQYGEGDIWLEDETQTYTALWWLENNINEDPLFASARADRRTYFLSQVVAGQLDESPCVDAGNGTASSLDAIIGMPLTTRTDLVADSATNDVNVDMGYHYPASSVAPQYQLTLEVVDQGYGAFGTVEANLPPLVSAGTYDVNQGKVIELRAQPDPNWEVYQWTGADYFPVYTTDPNYNKVTMNSDKTVTVEFGPKGAYKLVTHVVGDGTIEPSGLNTYAPGTVVALRATPANPSQVVIWTGTDDDYSGSQHNTITMDAHKEVFAEFYSPRTLYVPADYPTIQAAIDDADDGDIIEISSAPQPYTTSAGFRINGKAITITSINPDDPCCVANTIIRMDVGEDDHVGPLFWFNNVGRNTVLNGITIDGGRLDVYGGYGGDGRACGDAGGNGGWVSSIGIACGFMYDRYGISGGNASPTIKNCVITDCTIRGGDGGVGFNGCTEHPNGSEGGWPGGAYGAALGCFNNSNPVLINCTFRNNVATGGNGGNGGNGNNAVPGPWGMGGPGGGWYYGEGHRWNGWVWPYGPYELYTEYTGRGGAVYIDHDCSPVFVDCTFTNNRSVGGTNGICGVDGDPVLGREEPSISWKIDNFGGAVYVAGDSAAQFIGCKFNDNLSDTNNLPESSDMFVSYGGGIAFEDGADLTFEECTFSGNLATIGGGIYSSHSSPLIGDCNFLGNSAFHGGGVLLVGGMIDITGSSFNENEATVTAGQGGGLCLLGTNAEVVDCNFANNSTRGSGGGIYFSNKNVYGEDVSGDNKLLVKNCLITDNSASRDGGGISSNWHAEPNIVNCTIAGNIVTGVGFENGFGAGVYCSYNSYVNIINSIIWGNSGNIGVQGSQLAVATGVKYDPRPSTVNIKYSDVQGASEPNMFGRRVDALDLVFCIDSTGSLEDDIEAVKVAANQIANSIVTQIPDSRIAVMDFRDFNETPYGSDETDYPYRDVLTFTTDTGLVVNAINSLTASGGGDTPESVYAALMHCIDHDLLMATLGGQLHGASPASTGLGAWRTGEEVMRVILLMGDAEPHDPEPFTNYTVEDIVAAASGRDPIRIVSLMIGADVNATSYFGRLGGETGGTYLQANSADEVVDAMLNAINMVSLLPDPIFVDVNCVINWDAATHSWNAGSNNINADPRFVAGYYLSQLAAGQDINSPCINAGNTDANDPNIGLDTYTTRTDSFPDVYDPNYPDPNSAIVDMGYHYRLFVAPQYKLTTTTVAVPGVAEPLITPDDGYYYQYTVVHLDVNDPPFGYQVLWMGTDNDSLIGTENTVRMDRDREVTVTFVRNVCDLTTGVIGNGGTIMPASGTYPRGIVVALTADPDAGYRVKRWVGADDNNSTSTNNTVTMNGDKAVYVEFEQPVTITVPGDFSSIQQALDAAEEGDMVLIAPGTYTTSTGYYIHDSNITISGIAPEDPCVVAATAIEMAIGDEGYISTSAFVIYNVGPETVLNGITIRGFVHQAYGGLPGDELGEDGYNGAHAFGGGVICYMASPTIKNCRFIDCSVIGGNGGDGFDGSGSDPNDPNINGTDGGWPGRAYGGGLACLYNSSPAVINCTFENCVATGGDGGDGGNGGTTEDAYGQGGRGGGWYYGTDSRWYNIPWTNSSQGYERFGPVRDSSYDFYNEYTGRGGAVFVGEQCDPTFTHCTFINNRTEGGTCGITGLDGWPPQDRIEPSIHWKIENFGGAVFCEANSTPVFTDCNFVGNTADTTYENDNDDPFVSYGGAVAWEGGADVILENCKFTDNMAAIGGAMYGTNADAQIADCDISGNLAYQGGGFFGASGSAIIQKCILQNNFAGVTEGNDTGGQGGGIYTASMTVDIFDSNISSNEADASGGGIFFTGVIGSPTVMNCLITGNFAGRDGGGISANWLSEPNIVNCTIADNIATGIGFSAGYGGGVCCSYGNYTNIVNSIIWNNLSQNGPQLAVGSGFTYDPRSSTVEVSYSDIQGGQAGIFIDNGCALNWGVANLQADPCFATGPLGSYYLSQIDTNEPNQPADSPCVNAGNDMASNIGLSYPYTTRTDEVFDTNVVDMGYHYQLAHPIEFCSFCDLSHDGDVDLVDFAIFTLYWLNDECSEDNNWCDGVDFTFDSFINFEDLNLLYECWLSKDTEAPLPNPSRWRIAPYSTSLTLPYTVSMTAEPTFDAWGGLVEYYFECVTGNSVDRIWDPNMLYAVTNLDPNTIYGFRVKARDERGHETQWSPIGYAATGQVQVDVTPPVPNPMTWASVPAAVPGSSASITMTATTATDASLPIWYYFECTSDGNFTSGWQTNTTYLATGLTPDTTYTFRVKARDSANPPNETGVSVSASATTNAEGQQENTVPNPVWEVEPYETGGGLNAYVNMTAAEAIDTEGNNPVEYYFSCVSPSSINSGWTTNRIWNNVPVGREHQGLNFHFKVRDSLGLESGWSTTLPALW